MDIKEFIKNGNPDNALFIASVEDLHDVFRMVVKEYDQERIEREEREKNAEVFISQKETAEKLGITVATLWAWERKGLITKIKVGHKARYRLSEINKIIKGEKFA